MSERKTHAKQKHAWPKPIDKNTASGSTMSPHAEASSDLDAMPSSRSTGVRIQDSNARFDTDTNVIALNMAVESTEPANQNDLGAPTSIVKPSGRPALVVNVPDRQDAV